MWITVSGCLQLSQLTCLYYRVIFSRPHELLILSRDTRPWLSEKQPSPCNLELYTGRVGVFGSGFGFDGHCSGRVGFCSYLGGSGEV